MLAERLDDEPVELPLAPLHLHGLVFVKVELLGLVVDPATERNLPLGCDPVGAEAGAEFVRAARLLAVERCRALQAEHPVVPGIAGDGGPLLLAPELHLDGQARRHGIVGQKPQQAGADCGRELPPDDVVGVGAFGHRLERLGDAIEASPADEGERVLAAAAPRLRAGDQDMHLGFGAIAHVVDELDLGLEEVRVAVVAIEEDLQLWDRSCLAVIRGRTCHGLEARGEDHRQRGRSNELTHAQPLSQDGT